MQLFHARRELLRLAGKLQDKGSEEVYELLFRPVLEVEVEICNTNWRAVWRLMFEQTFDNSRT